MIVALLLAASFSADFPQAETTLSRGRVTHASNFEARGLGDTPAAAATAFLAQYAEAFGISPQQKLVPRGGGTSVHLERQIDGLPVFNGDLVVGIGANNAVVLVNGSDVPPASSGTWRYSRSAAARKAAKSVKGTPAAAEPRGVRGWKSVGDSLRPVWRIDLITENPAGEWRFFVDAETGTVLSRTSLRATLR